MHCRLEMLIEIVINYHICMTYQLCLVCASITHSLHVKRLRKMYSAFERQKKHRLLVQYALHRNNNRAKYAQKIIFG